MGILATPARPAKQAAKQVRPARAGQSGPPAPGSQSANRHAGRGRHYMAGYMQHGLTDLLACCWPAALLASAGRRRLAPANKATNRPQAL